MENIEAFYRKLSELEDATDYKGLFTLCLKYSKSSNLELATAAVGRLSTLDSLISLTVEKQIEYSIKVLQLEDGNIQDSSLYNLAVGYRFKEDLQAYKYFLEKALAYGDSSAALDLAILYSISDKEKSRVKTLLMVVVEDNNAGDTDKEEALQLLKEIDNYDVDYVYLLSKAPVSLRKLPAKKTITITDELTDLLLEAIVDYELGEYEKAFTQLKQLAYTYRLADAMRYLGDCYFYGKGTKPSYDDAATWYHELEKTGSVEGMLKLANLYKDIRQMRLYKYYLEKAQAKGCDKATLLLAKLYNVSNKENTRVRSLLDAVLKSKSATLDLIFEAEKLLKQLEND